MRAADRLRALSVLAAHPGRTLLTLLGIVVGSAAIVLVAGLVGGARAALIATSQSATGSDLVEVGRRQLPARERARGRPELSASDAEALADGFATRGRRIHAEAYRQTRVRSGAREKRVRLVSSTPEALELFRLRVRSGRFLDASDLSQRRRVCVVGHEVWTDLLGQRPLSSEPRIVADGVTWTVVGVLAKKPMIGSTTGTHVWDRKLVVPETTFDAVYANEHRRDRIVIQRVPASAAPELPLGTLRAVVERTLVRRHHGAKNVQLDNAAARAQERLILSIVEILLIAIGGLALGVGGINVTNVMLVAVSERTREIGLRRALGATRRSLGAQFLLEASVLSLIGGVAGLALGSGLVLGARVALGALFGPFPARVEPWALALGLSLALATGLSAGLFPALRAARLNPVDALRVE